MNCRSGRSSADHIAAVWYNRQTHTCPIPGSTMAPVGTRASRPSPSPFPASRLYSRMYSTPARSSRQNSPSGKLMYSPRPRSGVLPCCTALCYGCPAGPGPPPAPSPPTGELLGGPLRIYSGDQEEETVTLENRKFSLGDLIYQHKLNRRQEEHWKLKVFIRCWWRWWCAILA